MSAGDKTAVATWYKRGWKRWWLVLSISTAIYVGGDLGAGPRDGIMVGLEQLGFKIGNARTLLELVAFSIGFLLGGKIGIGPMFLKSEYEILFSNCIRNCC